MEGLDALKAAQNGAKHLVDDQQQAALDAEQAQTAAQQKLDAVKASAADRLDAESRRVELRVFVYRLALTLPLLGIAGWPFARKRGSIWWPFVWGFIIFALFAFFVEVVPHLPGYGGDVCYGVGIVVTVLIGRYGIASLNRYSERQRLVEQQPDKVRRDELNYDVALGRLAKGICPGCERAVDAKGVQTSFCPHCGIGPFNPCRACGTRKSAFAQFCQACGAPAAEAPSGPGRIAANLPRCGGRAISAGSGRSACRRRAVRGPVFPDVARVRSRRRREGTSCRNPPTTRPSPPLASTA